MGAYYEAALTANKKHTEIYGDKISLGKPFRVNTHDVDSNGLKLMEHSYISNSYVSHILGLIEDNPTNVIWLCDYSENTKYNWETVAEVETTDDEVKSIASRNHRGNGFILNHTTNEYISLKSYKRLFAEHSTDWAINPLPILTNSETSSMGGGDYGTEDSLRGAWKNHLISYTKKLGKFSHFKNVTKDVIFWEKKVEFVKADKELIQTAKTLIADIKENKNVDLWGGGDVTLTLNEFRALFQTINDL
jgi:hypothetical protein